MGRRAAAQSDASLPTEEAARRARQREKQQEALRLRGQGGDYAPAKKKRKTLERRKFDQRADQQRGACSEPPISACTPLP